MAVNSDWFSVDKDGLAKLLEQRGKAFALFELWQNAVDEDTTRIAITLRKLEGSPYAELTVEDDSPDGFADLRHAFTLFAESGKKGDPTKRGWMNFGEKLVLACCREATIATTTGAVAFTPAGRRHVRSKKRERGSVFRGEIRMTRDELEDVLRQAHRLLPPPDKVTTINGERLPSREPIASFQAALPTRVAGDDGVMVRTTRNTRVDIYEPREGETPSLYELGIPVVETGDRWHVDVQQKVPLNTDRDNVPPGYLRQVRTLVLNALHDRLTEREAVAPWVRDAASSEQCSDGAIARVLSLRYGDQRVAADPSDRESEGTAKAHGFAVVHGGSLTGGEWENAKRAGAIAPAGKLFPTPKPFHPGGKPLRLLDESKRTDGIRWFDDFARRVARQLLGFAVSVEWIDDRGWGFGGTYGDKLLRINVGAHPAGHYEQGATADTVAFLIHELAHHYGGHLEAGYHEALERFGGQLVALALAEPGFFAEGR